VSGLFLRPARRELVALAVCAITLALQLFLPGFIGLADNGDFPKISRPLCLGPADGRAQAFVYFVSDYERRPDLCWSSGLYSSALVPAWIASELEQIAGDPKNFDIRWLGAANTALFLFFFYVLLVAMRPLAGWCWMVACVFALWFFTDVSFVSYFNSFFSDSAALLGAMIAAAAAIWLLAADKVRLAPVCVFFGGALLYVTSKSQHAVLGVVPALMLAVIGFRAGKRAVRITSWAGAACLLGAMAWMMATTPAWYKGQPRFNLIFSGIALKSQTPLEDLRELGLGPDDLKYVGLNAFSPGGPANDERWYSEFCRRTSYGKVAAFYARHPGRTLWLLWGALGPADGAAARRPWNLSNFRREDGHPPGAKTERFASWSRIRDAVSRNWPSHIVVWYAMLAWGAINVLRRSKERFARALAIAALGIAAVAVGEFSLAALTDAIETNRHMLLFQLFTDFTMFYALLWRLWKWQARRDSNPRPPA
jgi:hypothetical protein